MAITPTYHLFYTTKRKASSRQSHALVNCESEPRTFTDLRVFIGTLLNENRLMDIDKLKKKQLYQFKATSGNYEYEVLIQRVK